MRIVVIGGSGHVGSFLVPRLVRAGREVVSLTRGARALRRRPGVVGGWSDPGEPAHGPLPIIPSDVACP